MIQALLQAYQHQALVSANTDLSNKFENSLSELQVTSKARRLLINKFSFSSYCIRVTKIRQQSINAKALKIVFLILNFRRYEAFQTVHYQ